MTGIFSFQSDRAGNFTRAQAAGAGVDILRGTVHDCLHTLDVGVPGTVAPTMRVRNLNAERNALITARTFGHNCLHLLFNSCTIIPDKLTNCKPPWRKNSTFFAKFFCAAAHRGKKCGLSALRDLCLPPVYAIIGTVYLRQHRTIPALRLKHRSGGCGTASALPKCSPIHKVLPALLA